MIFWKQNLDRSIKNLDFLTTHTFEIWNIEMGNDETVNSKSYSIAKSIKNLINKNSV